MFLTTFGDDELSMKRIRASGPTSEEHSELMTRRPDDSGAARVHGLTRDVVVTAALAVIDQHGLAAATMRGIALRLDVEAQSLYTHVHSREELFDAVVERVVSELDDDPDTQWTVDDPWQNSLAGIARGVRRYARRHPNAFALVAARSSQAPWLDPPLRSLRWVETFLSHLDRSGFDNDQVLFAYRTLNGFLLGFLLLETGERVATGTVIEPALTMTTAVGDVDQKRYPTVHRLAANLARTHYDEEFVSGVDTVIERIAASLSCDETPVTV